MPVTKVASEFKSDVDKASYFNSYLNKSLREKPIKNIDLRLEGFAENATLAFTYGFSAEFDFILKFNFVFNIKKMSIQSLSKILI